MSEVIAPTGQSVLQTALAEHNAGIAKANVAKVKAALQNITDHQSVIAEQQKFIAAEVKKITELNAIPLLDASQVGL